MIEPGVLIKSSLTVKNKKASKGAFLFLAERGIRTLDTFNRIHSFRACSFVKSSELEIVFELDKNLAHHSVDDIRNHLPEFFK